jgi:hypothetical protein
MNQIIILGIALSLLLFGCAGKAQLPPSPTPQPPAPPSEFDKDGPIITHELAVSGVLVSISANANDPSGVAQMQIHRSPDPRSMAPYADLVVATCFESSCENNEQLAPGDYYYFISAKDRLGNERVTPKMPFTVIDYGNGTLGGGEIR